MLIVGGGISAIQLLDEISRVTRTTWVTRRPPEFRDGPFDQEAGRAAVKQVEDRVRQGLPPTSVVSVTGLPLTPAIMAMRDRGVLDRQEMFTEITPDGVRWADGRTRQGRRDPLVHRVPQFARSPRPARSPGAERGHHHDGTIGDAGRQDPRVHLVGYGPSASTIGANRAGEAAAREVLAFLRRVDR